MSLEGMPVISTYTRAQALTDGALVAADPELRAQAGIRFPIAYTHQAHEDCVAWTDEDANRVGAGQDAIGREWDVLMLLRAAMRRAGDASHVAFTLARVDRDSVSGEPDDVELHAVVGPGDAGEPVITVMRSLDEL